MKPSFDYSVCEGLNLAYLHTITSSPPEMGVPGQEYFAGTHFNPNITWRKYSEAYFDYMARSQYMMQLAIGRASSRERFVGTSRSRWGWDRVQKKRKKKA